MYLILKKQRIFKIIFKAYYNCLLETIQEYYLTSENNIYIFTLINFFKFFFFFLIIILKKNILK